MEKYLQHASITSRTILGITAAGKPGGATTTGEELPHVRGQGLLDLEFESDGKDVI